MSDVFIASAPSDRSTFATPLADRLIALGVSAVVVDLPREEPPNLSSILSNAVEGGTRGVLILTPAFFAGGWSREDLRALATGDGLIGTAVLPLLDGVTAGELAQRWPELQQRPTLDVAGRGLMQIALTILQVVRPDLVTPIRNRLSELRGDPAGVEPGSLKMGPIRHQELAPDLMGRIRLIRAVLLPVYPQSMEFWVDGFRRDTHPENEIRIWERIATLWREFCVSNRLEEEDEKAAFKFVLGLGLGMPEAEVRSKSSLAVHLQDRLLDLSRRDAPIEEMTETENPFRADASVSLFPNEAADRFLMEYLAAADGDRGGPARPN